jgi:death-on-curing protein
MPVLSVLGGQAGAGVIEGILALPKQTAGGKPAYPSLFDKAAVLFRSLILDHPFVDGNKRMAVASALVFLWVNDEIVCATDRELVTKALAVAEGLRDWKELSEWFRMRTRSEDVIVRAIENGTLDTIVAGLPGRASIANRPLLNAVVAFIEAPA